MLRVKEAFHIIALVVLGGAMLLLPDAPRLTESVSGGSEVATVVEVDNSDVQTQGLIEFGTQKLKVNIVGGGVSATPAVNQLRGQLEFDKKFEVGDKALVTKGPEPVIAKDHYRITQLFVLFALFAVFLIAFAGTTGLKALFSFVFSLVAIWKVLIPACLNGLDPRLVSFGVVAFLTFVIMILVGGFTRKALSASLGSLLGIGASLVLAEVFSRAMHVNGATMPFVQTLMYSGFYGLSIPNIFVGSVILASSGAIMDLAMDIASAVEEVRFHNPTLSRFELMKSGFRVGRAVVGTMTTTLLLAYSGGYLTLLMVFAAEGTSPLEFLNSTLVSAELVKTLVGSFGLVLVAPSTALVSAFLKK